ncbi:hypothetical protein DD788_29185 [Ralstonia pickettii]|nr:hypothetical protein [Ralstonia pickettii]
MTGLTPPETGLLVHLMSRCWRWRRRSVVGNHTRCAPQKQKTREHMASRGLSSLHRIALKAIVVGT